MIHKNKRINIFNKGQTNISLWGSKLGIGPKTIEAEPRLITPNGGSYYLLADQLENILLTNGGPNSEIHSTLELYLSSLNTTKYTISTIIFAKIVNSQVSIHMQTTSIKPSDFTLETT